MDKIDEIVGSSIAESTRQDIIRAKFATKMAGLLGKKMEAMLEAAGWDRPNTNFRGEGGGKPVKKGALAFWMSRRGGYQKGLREVGFRLAPNGSFGSSNQRRMLRLCLAEQDWYPRMETKVWANDLERSEWVFWLALLKAEAMVLEEL